MEDLSLVFHQIGIVKLECATCSNLSTSANGTRIWQTLDKFDFFLSKIRVLSCVNDFNQNFSKTNKNPLARVNGIVFKKNCKYFSVSEESACLRSSLSKINGFLHFCIKFIYIWQIIIQRSEASFHNWMAEIQHFCFKFFPQDKLYSQERNKTDYQNLCVNYKSFKFQIPFPSM